MIGIVDYGVGNRLAIQNMLGRLGIDAQITSRANELSDCQGIILPGVGSFDGAAMGLAQTGLASFLLDYAHSGGHLLGICVGMQMLCDGSEEGELPGLGLIKASSQKFKFDVTSSLPIPHVGWNQVQFVEGWPLQGEQRFYFTHSYHVVCNDPADVLATTTYGVPFISAIKKGNVLGVQFHPEKSHRYGMALLKEFAIRCMSLQDQESSPAFC